jgi:hypothetical protein
VQRDASGAYKPAGTVPHPKLRVMDMRHDPITDRLYVAVQGVAGRDFRVLVMERIK